MDEIYKQLKWRRVKAGTKLPGNSLVYYDNDPDPCLSRTAIYDGYYISVSILQKLPNDD